MNLIVDIGNTSVKVALFNDSRMVKLMRMIHSSGIMQQILNFANSENCCCIVSNVTKNRKIEKQLSGHFKKTIVLSSETKMPFRNLYKTPKTLGNDRLANAAAAYTAFAEQNVLVVDAGTCLKFDFISSKGHYHGGAISPGLNMRYRALNQFTGNLPLIQPGKVNNLVGKTTEQSIRSGVQNGMTAEIIYTILQYKDHYSDMQVILTGGDYRFFANKLKSYIFARPDFTLEGLNQILKFNIECC